MVSTMVYGVRVPKYWYMVLYCIKPYKIKGTSCSIISMQCSSRTVGSYRTVYIGHDHNKTAIVPPDHSMGIYCIRGRPRGQCFALTSWPSPHTINPILWSGGTITIMNNDGASVTDCNEINVGIWRLGSNL